MSFKGNPVWALSHYKTFGKAEKTRFKYMFLKFPISGAFFVPSIKRNLKKKTSVSSQFALNSIHSTETSQSARWTNLGLVGCCPKSFARRRGAAPRCLRAPQRRLLYWCRYRLIRPCSQPVHRAMISAGSAEDFLPTKKEKKESPGARMERMGHISNAQWRAALYGWEVEVNKIELALKINT